MVLKRRKQEEDKSDEQRREGGSHEKFYTLCERVPATHAQKRQVNLSWSRMVLRPNSSRRVCRTAIRAATR